MTAMVNSAPIGYCAMRPNDPMSVWAWRANQARGFTASVSSGGAGGRGHSAVANAEATSAESIDEVRIMGRDHDRHADIVEPFE
jgi:hypothetical protein